MASELIVHVEGGTTNGRMIKFQKGAFVSLGSVRPKAVKYNTFGQLSPSSGILDGILHHVLVCTNIFTTITYSDLPIFKPNAYFFEHH